ncbi:MAG: TonB-dependent receptor [Chitinophagaceae bacterium]
MRKRYNVFAAFIISCMSFITANAQTVTISGTVTNNTSKEIVPAVSVVVKGTSKGTYTNSNGEFTLKVNKLPVVLTFSSIGFDSQDITVSDASKSIEVDIKVNNALGQEVVIAATRAPSKILESPITIERITNADIKNSPASNYYEILGNVKGVDLTTSSLTFKTVSTRGFNGSGNLRFNQIVDGMDNQAPGLNFSVGSVIGLTELDVESMELLPGASSALYGPGGMNGTLIINSKNPFKFQGFSFLAKTGIMHTDQKYRNASPYYNWSARLAKAIGNKFAFKLNMELVKANDLLAADDRNFARTGTTGKIVPGSRTSDPNYNGVNIYGDETSADIRAVLSGIAAQAPFLAPFIATLSANPINVSRTGYKEIDIVDPETLNYKIAGALHYKLTSKIEAIFSGYWGTGKSVYTGSDRYALKGLKMGQYKLELNHPNWFLRGYTTQENAGETYNSTVATQLFNEAWKPSPGSTGWFAQYGQAYLSSKLAGAIDIDAHNQARAIADIGRPVPGSQQFKTIFNDVISKPIPKGGKFIDQTDLYNYEGQYNLSHITGSFADVLVGANYKKYVLNSRGTLFADSAGTIGISEFGAYVQVSKGFAQNKIKLSVSGRYDKNENFSGKFTPRATMVINVAKNNNLRFSYQTAYRFPSTQNQWINLAVGGGTRLIGGLPTFRDFYKFNTNPVYSLESVIGGSPKTPTFSEFKPESVKSYEAGYKGLIANGKLLIDLYGYLGNYTDFISSMVLLQANSGNPADLADPSKRTAYSVSVNAPQKVKTSGYGLGIDYRFYKKFSFTSNFSSDILGDLPVGFVSYFNTPKYRFNIGLSNNGFGKDQAFGFNIAYKWQDKFFYQGTFITGNIEAVQTVDAQISYKIPLSKSQLRIGANNLLNQYYRNAAGNPSIGGLYYVSYGYNIF